jgi:single-stranded-DNA-specific exonuclease
MDAERFISFLKAIEGTAQDVKSLSVRRASIVHHNDTDGIAAGAILRKALQRDGFETENIPIERIHPLLLPRIHTLERELIFYTDLGGQAGSLISKYVQKGSSTIILDHHPPFQPASEALSSDLLLVTPETFGIDGDLSCSAATVVFLLAKALNKKNEDLAYLGVLGGIGDHQTIYGKLTGLNQMVAEIAKSNGSVSPGVSQAEGSYLFTLFNEMPGCEVSRWISELAVSGYYRKGADLAIRFCLDGPSDEAADFGLRMQKIQEDRFQKEKGRLQAQGIPYEGPVQWIDVEERFHPLGVKAIGIFCSEISQEAWIHPDKYILGFQNLPQENPYLGKFDWDDTKVSMRLSPELHRDIEKGLRPDLTQTLPPAAERAGGFADACHRYSAASTIPKKNRLTLIRSLVKIIREWEEKKQSGGQ